MSVQRISDGWLIGAEAEEPWLVGVLECDGATLWWPADGGEPGGLVWDAPRASGWIDAVFPGTVRALAAAGALSGVADDGGGQARTALDGPGVAGDSDTADDADDAGGVGDSSTGQGSGAADDSRAAEHTGGHAEPPADAQAETNDGPLTAPARAAALGAWLAAWWPASRIAGVAALDPRIVAAERVAALASLDGVLDDDGAIERALEDCAGALAAVGGRDDAGAEPLLRRVAEIADDYGVPLGASAVRAARADDYALAAAGESGDAALARGESRVDPLVLPAGLVDPAAAVSWSVALGAGGATLAVSVPAAPQFAGDEAPRAALVALIAGVEVPLALAGDVWAGAAAVPATFLSAAAGADAALTVAGFAADQPESVGDEHPADILIRIARERLARGESLAERLAR